MNIGIMVIVAVAGLWAISIFIGMIGNLSKTSHGPAAIDSSLIQAQEQKTIDETEAKRQQMMDDMKRKIEDSSQKF